MDEHLRRQARLKITYAKELDRNRAFKGHILQAYAKGIDFLLQISKKNTDDLRSLANVYYRMAVIHFNRHHYQQAAECYNQSINHLAQCELNDEIYRKLTERYIDLADTCYELGNQNAGNKAMEFAIKAFGLIKMKTDPEKAIGDPTANFKQFHDYFEQELSADSYLQSTEFENHQVLMSEIQQEKSLFAQFDSISIGEKNQMEQSIEQMLAKLSVADKKEQPLFSPISIHDTPSADDYRQSARQILRLAKTHINNGLVMKAIETYEQVIEYLNSIEEPNQSDLDIIKTLRQQIFSLQKRSTSAAAGLQQHGVFAAAAAAPAAAPQMMEEEQEDVQMDYDS